MTVTENLHFDEKFHDVIENGDDGQLILNLFNFHKTLPLPEPKTDASPDA